MLKVRILFTICLSMVSLSVFSENRSLDAAIGGGLGGAAGGFLGSEIGGKTGAIIGSSTGAAIGAAISTKESSNTYRNYDRDKRYYGNHDHDDYYPKYKKHKKFKGCPPGLAMQGRC